MMLHCISFCLKQRVLALAGIYLLLIGTSQAGIVLLDDTFADGSRSETNLPTESGVYFGIPTGNTPQGSASVAPGVLTHVLDSSSTKMWTHFAPNGSPVELTNIGSKIVATVEYTPKGSLYSQTSRSFRMGLFNDPTTAQVVMDVNDDGGGAGDPWQDSTGYGVNIPLQTNATTPPFDISKRINQNSSLIGSGSAFVFGMGGGAPVASSVDTKYSLSYIVERTSATTNTVRVTLADAGGVLSTHAVVDNGDTIGFSDSYAGNLSGSNAPWTKFDHLMFRFSTNSQVADQLDFHRIRVEFFPVPEPASLMIALIAAAGLTVQVGRRR